jgi:hypothetical protein
MCILTRSQEIAIFSILLWGIKDAITKRRSKSYGIVKIAVVANPSIRRTMENHGCGTKAARDPRIRQPMSLQYEDELKRWLDESNRCSARLTMNIEANILSVVHKSAPLL